MSADMDRLADQPEQNEPTPLDAFAGIVYVKMSGSGNDFVVVDNRAGVLPEESISPWTRAVCRRRVSVGADGVVLLQQRSPDTETDHDFGWRYFNADGTEGEMCGNGAMCGAHVAHRAGIAGERMRFLTPSGIVSASVESFTWGSRVWLDLPDIGLVGKPVTVDSIAGIDEFVPVEVGVPHAVSIVDDADGVMDDEVFDRFGRAVRYDAAFAPAGTNVNIISVRPEGGIRMRTWERGVEAETLACGTGAVASALVAVLSGSASLPVTVRTTSGEDLIVDLTLLDERQATAVRLGGRAVEVARGVIATGAFQ